MAREIANSEDRHLGPVNEGRATLEDVLANIWAEVLRLPHVDPDANFFEMGGDSLKAMDVVVRVSEALHIDLPLIAFFEQPTIRHLAKLLSGAQESTEAKLATIWEEVLRVPRVGRDANFFDIGGDSLKAMDVIVRVSEVLQVDLPLIAFFEEPTVTHLAAVIDELKSAGTTPAITRVVERSEFPLSYSQQIFWLLEQQNPGTGIYNKPRIFRIRGKLDPIVLERSLNELRQRHEILRVRFIASVNGPVQVVEGGGALQLAIMDLSSQEPSVRQPIAMKLALETVREPLDLASGQVQRASLIQLSAEEFVLCIAEHHVVNDGFTGSILLDELGAIYEAFAAGESNPLPPPALHYTDYAVWEQQWMQGERLAREVDYWRSTVSDAPASLELPTDSAPSHEPDRRGHLRSITVSPGSLQQLQAFAQSNGTTQFTVMSAALRLLLYRWSGQADFLLGTTSSNRSRSGTERMIGPFVNPLPLRNPIVGGLTMLDLLNSEKNAVMEAFAHQDCPFAKIVEAVNPERTSNDNPLFNVGLVMENFPEIELKGRHFEAEYLNFDPEVALLDLRFIAIEKHGALRISCEYKSALFDPRTVDALLLAYTDVLDTMASDPAKRIDEFSVGEVLTRQAKTSAFARKQSVAIAATYTAEPMREPLEFWLRELGMPAKINFAPFNQVFQQLLDPNSLLANNECGANVVLVRMEDLQVTEVDDAADTAATVDSSVDELLAALRVAASRLDVAILVFVGPPSDSALANPDIAELIERAESKLVTGANEIAGVQIVGSGQLLRRYPVGDYVDDYSYQISHIPYRPAFFTAMATMIVRRVYGARRARHEVIVLDCDNAIWNRALAAKGATGGVVDPGHAALQELMVAQEDAGMILCLCGRYTEAAVTARFAQSAGMKLGWQNIASSRFGVRAKSEGLKELANELSLGLDRFIFITADPIDAAEVHANCPSVVVAELPADAALIPNYLANFWAFDRRVGAAAQPFELRTQADSLNRIATQLATVNAVTQAIESSKVLRARVWEAYAPPRSPVEEFLADVWARLLRVARPGIHDNFFALGGHSLMAAQVIARVRQTLGVELPLRAMFDAPTIDGFADLIEAERRARTGVVVPAIRRAPREGDLPPSFAQQRLWFIDQLEPGSPLYNISPMYRMRGPLNVAALERTINEIVRRHESLRTTFRNVDGQPVQVIGPELWLPLEVTTVSGSRELDREAEVQRLTREAAVQPFDLATGPLVRASLLRIGEEDHVLMVVMHHIVGDGWSGSLMAGEMAALYEAFAHGRPSPLPELDIQFADFAVWQRLWLRGEVREKQVDYWRRQLAGAPAVLELPTDRPRPAVQSHRGGICTHMIPSDLVDRLEALSQAEGATLFMTLLAGFQLLLSRYSGQEDIVVGSTVAGRNYAEIEPLIGFFVNTLAMRTDLSGDPTCRELLARVKQAALDGYAHQDIPFERLVEELQPERSLSHNPIFQVLFGLQNLPSNAFATSGLSVERTSVHTGTSILDMSWFAFESADGMLLRVEYDTDLFDDATIVRAIGHFEKLLEGIAAHPDGRISDLPLMGDKERNRILVEFNDTSVVYPDVCVHDLVAKRTERQPDAVALISGTQRVTYHELNAHANQVANYLIKRGAGPDVLVGIYAERTPALVTGILGILKSGSAYVPIDPSYPKDRLNYVLEDAQAPIVLTQTSLVGELAGFPGEIICLDADWPEISREPDTNPITQVHRGNLAYVLFTSGSTGRPKGVAIEHRSAATFVHWAREAFDPQELAGVLFSTSMCFDLSVFEVFVPLSSGGCVILAENALYLPTLPAKDEVSLINTVPSAMAELVRLGGVPNSVKTVNLAGEALSGTLVEQIYENTKVNRVYNLYGPTEDTTYSTYTLVPQGAPVTIGRPIANSQAYILDRHLNPVPIGVRGELYLAGEGLARGYYGRPDLTSERFVRSPFSREAGARMYRTGDLCRYLPDGNIEYLGRIDHQVKLRGFRIELDEIEAALDSHPRVRQSVVLAREDAPGDKRLVAYVIPQSDASEVLDSAAENSPNADLVRELRRSLSEKLPEFMMPSAFVWLQAMPLSPNGKINRGALPAPERSRDEAGKFVAPRNAVEEKLSEIWAEVLRVPTIGVYDNFFGIGGHSLLATQVVSRIRRWAHVELPLRSMFESPTIAELALRVSQSTAGVRLLPPIRRAPRDHALPLSFAQQRLWFLSQLEPDSPFYNIPMALRLSGTLQVEALKRALNGIIQRHEVLRTTFVFQGEGPIQVVLPELTIDIPMVDLTELPERLKDLEVQRLAAENSRHLFDLQTGPLIRASLLRLGEREHILLLTTHHIVSDGWSIWQFANDLVPLYDAICEGKPSPLSELAIQYADYASWQRQWLRGELHETQVEYWHRQLADAPAVLELPTDRPRPAVQSHRGDVRGHVVPRELVDRLKTLGQEEGTTLFMTLLAAFQLLLSRYSGQEDIVVGSTIAGRNYAEVEPLIGFFVNTLALRTDLSGDPTCRELLARVKQVALDAWAHQEIPFERLVEELQPERSLSYNPIFQVLFSLQSVPRQRFEATGLQMERTLLHQATSIFDMSWFAFEAADGLRLRVEYDTDLFEDTTIVRALCHFEKLLEGIAGQPGKRISELPLLGDEERQKILTGFNQTAVEFPNNDVLHDFVARQADQTPEATAIIFGDQRLTYHELNSRANQVAHYLIKRGAGPETLVGIYTERTADMLVAILGVLKSGGAYVPLDPNYPKERLRYTLQDAKALLVLTQKSLSDDLPNFGEKQICLDADWQAISQEPQDNPVTTVKPANLAYVLFTSGSTGRPKGVAIEHGSAATFVHWANGVFTPDELAGVLLSTSICFDLSVFEIFVTWSAGGKVIVAENALFLPILPAKDEVTLINTVPSAMAELLRMNAAPESVQTVNLAGEALPEALVELIYQTTSVRRVYNLYGPTEDTTYSTYTLVEGGKPVTIGRPIANSQVYILDAKLQPVPIGLKGELYLAGEGLARGYYGRPELTRERFVPNPFGAEPEARMYRTGDVGRWLADGEIQYLGRIDHQVKIRGFRIELGEIETALDAHPAIQQSVVLAREDEPGTKRLVAYVVADPNYRGGEQDGADEARNVEQVSQWATTFDEAYRRAGDAADATFNISGWDSSYTGESIPAEDMRVWVDSTAERIRALRAKRVWEIGCGTGLLLFRVAPACEHYHGTDISKAALDFLQQQLQRSELKLSNVTLERRAAHELDTGSEDSFDAVVLNSVAQYFPNLEYLVTVIEGGVRSLRPDGAMFLGDLRSFPLLKTFHASVQLFQGNDSTTREQFWMRVGNSVRKERELLIDPSFFAILQQRIPAISRVEVQLKRGRAQNELTRFRYDVVLHVGTPAAPRLECAWLDWKEQKLSADQLREILHKAQPEIIGINGIPNARLAADIEAVQLLRSSAGAETLGEVRQILRQSPPVGVEPEDLFELGQDEGYAAEIRSSVSATDGCLDVVFRREDERDERSEIGVPRFPGETGLVRPWETYASSPLRRTLELELVPQLRSWLGDKLPEFMVPTTFVIMDAMPLSANGKINRKALPVPQQSRTESLGDYRAPQTPTEELIAATFADVLRLERVGLDDNFFELGGHSLSATQVVSRIRQNLGVDLPVRTVFESPTVATLARAAEQKQRGEAGAVAPPIVPVPRDQRLPLSFAQQRLWVLDQIEPNNPLYNIPWATRLTGLLNVEALESALNAIVERHEILRTTYISERGEPFQVISPALKLPLPVIDLSELPTAERERDARRLAQNEASTPFDLAKDPMTRNLLLKMGDEDHILVLNTHHIASDGWSTGILLRELTALYEAAVLAKPAPLPKLPIQYADYAVWQRNWLQGEVLDEQLAYWKDQLRGAPPVLLLPTDRPRPPLPTFRGAMHRALLPVSLTEAIHVISRQNGGTAFMTMLAAFQTVILHYTKQPDIVLGTDLANRTTVQTEALIGFFVNLLALRTDLSGDPTFDELLGRVREVALGAYAHQDVPFDKLVEELQPERNLSHNPLVQVLFVQQNRARAASPLRDLEMNPYPLEVPSKFDIVVFVSETDKGVAGTWLYHPDLFDATTISRMARLYQLVLEAATANPAIRLSDLVGRLAEEEKLHRASQYKEFQQISGQKLKTAKRKTLT